MATPIEDEALMPDFDAFIAAAVADRRARKRRRPQSRISNPNTPTRASAGFSLTSGTSDITETRSNSPAEIGSEDSASDDDGDDIFGDAPVVQKQLPETVRANVIWYKQQFKDGRFERNMARIAERVQGRLTINLYPSQLCAMAVMQDWADNTTSVMPLTMTSADIYAEKTRPASSLTISGSMSKRKRSKKAKKKQLADTRDMLTNQSGGMVCMEMGMGKSMATLLHGYLRGAVTIIAVKHPHVSMWSMQFRDNMRNVDRDFPVLVYQRDNAESTNRRAENKRQFKEHLERYRRRCAIVVSHDLFKIDYNTVFNNAALRTHIDTDVPVVLVVDEVDTARNPDSRLCKRVSSFDCDSTVLITASPDHGNRDKEWLAYAMMLKIVPSDYKLPTGRNEGRQALQSIQEWVSRRMFVLDLEDANIFLPECNYYYEMVELSDDERVVYDWICDMIRRMIDVVQETVQEIRRTTNPSFVNTCTGELVLREIIYTRQAAVSCDVLPLGVFMVTEADIRTFVRRRVHESMNKIKPKRGMRKGIMSVYQEDDREDGNDLLLVEDGAVDASVSEEAGKTNTSRTVPHTPVVCEKPKFVHIGDTTKPGKMRILDGPPPVPEPVVLDTASPGHPLKRKRKRSTSRKNAKKKTGQDVVCLGDIERPLKGAPPVPRPRNFPFARIPEYSTKLRRAAEMCHSFVRSGSKVLVYAVWVRVLDRFEPELKRLGVKFERLDGKVTRKPQEQDRVIQSFRRDPSVGVLMMTTNTGSYGLDLTVADKIIRLQPGHNPQPERQGAGRAHRNGQLNRVSVYYVITKDTIEEDVHVKAARKAKRSDRRLDKHVGDYNYADVPEAASILETEKRLEQGAKKGLREDRLVDMSDEQIKKYLDMVLGRKKTEVVE